MSETAFPAVVQAIFAIIFLDAVFAMIFLELNL